MNINWYPGHMKKTIESLKSMKAQCDVAVVLLDARIPVSSYNPLLDEVLTSIPVLMLLNKSDLADPKETQRWIDHFNGQADTSAIAFSATSKLNEKKLTEALESSVKDLREREAEKRHGKAQVARHGGGDSQCREVHLHQSAGGKKSAAIGNRPGITKTNQWIRHHKAFDLLDTPGVLWPKLDPPIRGRHLAYTGSIKDEIMDVETLAFELVKEAMKNFEAPMMVRYNLTETFDDPVAVMDAIGKRRGCLIRGGEIDYTKVSHLILDEFRAGKWGAITLEHVDDRSEF